jgi:hypothetical protein
MANKNKNKKKKSKNPLSNMDPISQIREFKDNVNELNDNFKNIIKIVRPMVKNGIVMPCTISKKFSDTLCSLTNTANSKFELLDNSLSTLDLNNMVDNKLTNNISNIIGGDADIIGGDADIKDYNNSNNKELVNTNYSKLIEDKKGRYFGRKRIQSGGYLNKEVYKYIINPITGRKVLLHGKIGKQILKTYINQLEI